MPPQHLGILRAAKTGGFWLLVLRQHLRPWIAPQTQRCVSLQSFPLTGQFPFTQRYCLAIPFPRAPFSEYLGRHFGLYPSQTHTWDNYGFWWIASCVPCNHNYSNPESCIAVLKQEPSSATMESPSWAQRREGRMSRTSYIVLRIGVRGKRAMTTPPKYSSR